MVKHDPELILQILPSMAGLQAYVTPGLRSAKDQTQN